MEHNIQNISNTKTENRNIIQYYIKEMNMEKQFQPVQPSPESLCDCATRRISISAFVSILILP